MKIGIDFGTTFSLPAALINGSPATLLPGGAYGIPSVFYNDAKIGILIGQPAENRGDHKPANVVRDIKMFISDTSTKTFMLDKKSFTKKEIVGEIINEVYKTALEEIALKQLRSQDIEGAVISVPAAFDIRELDFIKQAAENIAKLNVLGFIREPVAAAIAYFNTPAAIAHFNTTSIEDKKTILVYDLGGGTCDVAIVRADKNAKELYRVLASDMLRIGGRDWDKVLVEMIKRKCREENEDIEFSKRDEAKIRKVAVEVKIALSKLDEFASQVEIDNELYEFEITRKDFERKSSELLQTTIKMVEKLKKNFGGKIDYIVCVGGSSKMPQVKAAFEKNYPDIELRLYEPEKAIAFGAAFYANHLKEEDYLRDICKFSYGARYIEDFSKYKDKDRLRVWNIIYKGVELPASGESVSYKVDEDQNSIYIAIYESECTDDIYMPKEGKYIGDIELSGIRNSKTSSGVRLTMTIDRSGLMHLKAIDKQTGKSVEADIHLDSY